MRFPFATVAHIFDAVRPGSRRIGEQIDRNFAEVEAWADSLEAFIADPVTALDDLSDVDTATTPPADGEVLTYDSASSTWVPEAVTHPAIPSSVDDLADVDTSTAPPTVGQALVWDDTPGVWVPGTVAAGSSAIDDLTDVDTTTVPPTAGQALVWDDIASLWEPGTVAGGGALDDLSDVDTASSPPADGDSLVYDSGSSLWVPGTVSGGGGGTAEYVGARVSKTAAQSLSSTVWTALTFDVETFDTDALHDSSTNTSRLTVPVGMDGKWRASAVVSFANLNDAVLHGIEFYVNGVAAGQRALEYTGKSGAYPSVSLTDVLDLVAGDYVEVHARHDHGSARDVNGVFSLEASPGGVSGGATEYTYVERTSDLSVTATTEAGANTVVTTGALSFDGSTQVEVEFYAPGCRPDAASTSGPTISLYLFDGSTSLGRIHFSGGTPALNNGGTYTSIRTSRRLTPSAGSHTYSIRSAVNTGSGLVIANTGGAGADVPAFIRVKDW